MKKNHRKIFNLIILSFFFFFCPLLVKAEGTAISGFKMEGNPYLGETFDIVLYLDDIKGTSDDLGLAGIQGYFYYDEDKLELISYESLAPYTIIVSGNRVVGLGLYEYMNGYQDILKFTFKAKKVGRATLDFPDLDSPDSKAQKVYITGSQLDLDIIDPVTMDLSSLFILTKNKKQLTATYNLEGTVGGTWSSSNPSVATVDQTGLVTGISPGKAIITYKTSNGYSAHCEITVSNYLKGDVNRDGSVNIKDAMEIMYIVTGRKPLTEDVSIIGDLNDDKSVNIKDAMEIMYIVTGRK